MSEDPKVLILKPVNNAAAQPSRYVELIEALEWPRKRLTPGMLESDSQDTRDRLDRLRPRLKARCAHVTISSHDGFVMPAGQERWVPSCHLRRRKIETEGLGIMASDMGVQCWGLPDLEAPHVPD